jgi:hypothetical protein
VQILRETDVFEDVGYTYVSGVTTPWLTLMRTPQSCTSKGNALT